MLTTAFLNDVLLSMSWNMHATTILLLIFSYCSVLTNKENIKQFNMEDLLKELKEIKQLLSLNKKVLTLDEFCLYTGISKSYAYRLTSLNKIKFYRPFGKMIFFDIEEVVDFLKTNTIKTKMTVDNSATRYLVTNKIEKNGK